MKKIYFALAVLSMLCALPQLSAQGQTQHTGDSTVSIPVSGVCQMCKDRIEGAAKGRGVRLAVWDMNKKVLTVVFNPGSVTIDKIRKRVVEAGHDAWPLKADNDIYAALPACCLYRDIKDDDQIVHPEKTLTSPDDTTGTGKITGVVMEEDKKGNFAPLRGASVVWLGTQYGTTTDSNGVFVLNRMKGGGKLTVSYAGYAPDTLTADPTGDMIILLAPGVKLGDVTVYARQKTSYVSSLGAVRTQVMTEKELFKAACCNLSESFETNPSVDVSYNDAITGSKQIQLLGLSGNYTQLSVESMPGPRGLATAQGLNFIAGPWVESIQLNKGVGSVVNGFESIAGQINVELKKPEQADPFFFNFYINSAAKSDLNVVMARKLGKRWSTALLLHDNFMTRSNVDFNKDGFRDMPAGNLFSVINRWKYSDGKNWEAQAGIKVLESNQIAGETEFEPEKHRLGTVFYGVGMKTSRYEVFGKIGYVFPEKRYKSIGLQVSAYSHLQDSYFGTTVYDGRQKNLYVNLIYQSLIGTTTHKFRTGISFNSDSYNELFKTDRYRRTENVPGTFFEYTYSPVPNFNAVAGVRIDYNNLYSWFATARMHLRYEPVKGTTIRISAGRGQRTANIFAENNAVFVSGRQVQVVSSYFGKAYGLSPEVAWNKGISIDQKLRLFNRNALFSLEYFRNDFRQQVITDVEDAHKIYFYNLTGKSFSNSVQAELSMEPVRKLDVRIAWRFFDVQSAYRGHLMEKPFTAKHRAFANFAYEYRGWKLDYTVNYIGPKRIPLLEDSMSHEFNSSYSEAYFQMNAQVTKTLGKKKAIDVYAGGENLTNFMQHDMIISPDTPFGANFDASMIWGPVNGRLIYAGIRYRVK